MVAPAAPRVGVTHAASRVVVAPAAPRDVVTHAAPRVVVTHAAVRVVRVVRGVAMTSLGWELARALLFRLDAELAHDISLRALAAASDLPGLREMLGPGPLHDPRLRVRAFGVDFANPLGVAAGLDKGARAASGLARLGFGAVEIGTVTPRPQPGNPRPRAFRLTRDEALINRFGFNSEGATLVGSRLESLAARASERGWALGVNVGKNRDTPPERAVDDHVLALRRVGGVGDWVTVNVSSPNTPGLRDLQGPRFLASIVEAVVAWERADGAGRPVLVKLSPDLALHDLDAALDAAGGAGAAGFVVANTTSARPAGLIGRHRHEAGGLSGAPLLPRTLELVRHAFRRVGGERPIVGVGGARDADAAWALVRSGATLVQAYTGFVLGGPGWPREVLRGLSRRVEASGARSIVEAIGADA